MGVPVGRNRVRGERGAHPHGHRVQGGSREDPSPAERERAL